MKKTKITPLIAAELFELSYCPVDIVLESKLSHTSSAHYGFVPKLSRYGGKNHALRAEKPFAQ